MHYNSDDVSYEIYQIYPSLYPSRTQSFGKSGAVVANDIYIYTNNIIYTAAIEI